MTVSKERAYTTTMEAIQFRWDFKAGLTISDDKYVPIGEYIEVIHETKSVEKKYPMDMFDYVAVDVLAADPFLLTPDMIESFPGSTLLGSKKIAQGGDVLFCRLGPSIGNRKSLYLHPDIGQVLISGEFHVLRPKEGFTGEGVLCLMKSDAIVNQAKAKGRGATPSRIRLHRNDLPNLLVPKFSSDELEKMGNRYIQGRMKAERLRKEAASLVEEVSPDF